MKRFQIVLTDPKTQETKIRNIERYNFPEAASKASFLCRAEWEKTKNDSWIVAAIYDMDYKFDIGKQVT
jgi:hypothetical protein|tara:strand:- start:1065 stop:1271 length:207 start_codon:yes stop_codon:yes gene_type:complete